MMVWRTKTLQSGLFRVANSTSVLALKEPKNVSNRLLFGGKFTKAAIKSNQSYMKHDVDKRIQYFINAFYYINAIDI